MATPTTAVFYREEDYATVSRRLLIDAVDTIVAGAVSIGLSILILVLWSDDRTANVPVFFTWAIVWFCYFVLLKRSRFRTAGYVIARTKIVNLRGETPSVLSLTARLLFVVAGPLNFLVDLLWIPSDPARQALRDKFAHTYVVRRAAVPAGVGAVVYRTYTVFGATLVFPEVLGEVRTNSP